MPTGFFAQTRQVRNMIGVRMSKEDEFHSQLLPIRRPHHLTAIGAGIKSCRSTTGRIPHQIGIDGHAVIMRVELAETAPLINFFRMPFAPGKFAQWSRRETQNRRYTQKRQLIEIAVS